MSHSLRAGPRRETPASESSASPAAAREAPDGHSDVGSPWAAFAQLLLGWTPARRVQFREQYARAVESYYAGAGEAALRDAHELGREAIAEGVSLSELVDIHHQAKRKLLIQQIPPDRPTDATIATIYCTSCPIWCQQPEEYTRLVQAIQSFFAKSLSPFETERLSLRKASTVLSRLNELREEEARRISRALHDEAAQLLASVHLALENVCADLPLPQRDAVRNVRKLLDNIEEHLRHLSHELRPTVLDDLGIAPALEFLAEGVSARTGMCIEVENLIEGRLPKTIETALYRVVREALTNAAKHAKASQVCIQLRRDARVIHCVIRDNGVGFEAGARSAGNGEGGLGLIGIRERLEELGGSLSVTSEPGRGATLVASIPLPAGSRERGQLNRRHHSPMGSSVGAERQQASTGK